MDRKTGRPNHIEDALILMKSGQWFFTFLRLGDT